MENKQIMPSQLFNLKRYFGGKTSQEEENLVTLTDGQATRGTVPPIPDQSLTQPPQAVGTTLNPLMEPAKQQDLSLLTHFSQRLNTSITLAAQEATRTKQASIEHDPYEIDLTQRARDNMLDPVINREKEIEQITTILLRRTKNNPLLVGERGVGKTAIVEGLAQKMVKGEVPIDLRDKRIIKFDLTTLVANASHQSEFEERLKRFIKELKDAGNDVILFIDGIHTIMGVGANEGALDASNTLNPFLARGEIQLIGTSRIEEYHRYIEKGPVLERRFQQVLVEEPTTEEAIVMLSGVRHKYESFHSVTIPDNTIEAAVKLSRQYIGGRFLPDKAVALIDEAAAKIRLTQTDGKENVVTPEDIAAIVSSQTRISVTRLLETESERLLNLEKLIHKSFIDQEGAVSAVAEAVRRGSVSLTSTNRPVGSFLFMGPTGVGKTELAKTLAFVLFGSETFMFRLDMNEYMEKYEITKLIGAPFGYIGYEEGGRLTEAARTMPYSVILLDEIEKAHPDLFNTLFQIFEEGRLTDNKGRTVSFKNTIIIATSNVGGSLIQKQDTANLTKQAITHAAQSDQEISGSEVFTLLTQKLLEELRKFFKAKLLNRFDEIIFFKPLTKENMLSIATLGIDSTKRLLSIQNISLEITSGALNKLSELGASPLFGARPLRHIIQTHIENPISTLLIQKVFQENDAILIDYDAARSEFVFGKKPTPETNVQAEVPLPASQPIPAQTPPVVPSQMPNGPPPNPFASIAQTIPMKPFNQNPPMPSSETAVHT